MDDLVRGRPRANSLSWVVAAWWVATLLVWLIGWPIHYARVNVVLVVGLMFANLVALLLPSASDGRSGGWGRWDNLTYWVPRFGVIVSWVLLPVWIEVYTPYTIFDLATAMRSQSAVYQGALAEVTSDRSGRAAFLLAQSTVSWASLLATPWFFFRWLVHGRDLVWLILAVGPPLMASVFTGRDQQIGFLGAVFVGVLVMTLSSQRHRVRQVPKYVLALAGVVAVVAFSARKLGRFAVPRVECPPGDARCVLGNRSTLFDAVEQIASYASQGYEGLGRAMDGHWVFGGGWSHASSLASLLGSPQTIVSGEVTGPIPTQLDQLGWSSSGLWSTGFAALAADVPWVLVPLLIFVIAVAMTRAADETERYANPISLAVAAYAFTGLLWMPQNYQLGISGPNYIGVLTILLVWILLRFSSRFRRLLTALDRALGTLRIGARARHACEGSTR